MITLKYKSHSCIILSCLSADKDYKNDNIHFYMVECDKNMIESCYASFLTFHYITSLTPFDFLEVK